MLKISKNISLFLILSFAIYCALIIGKSWDEGSYILLGKERLSYLLSLGINKLNEPFWNSHHYPGISYTLNAFVLSLFPSKYEFEITHLFNLSISLSAVFGISKIAKELFNKKVSTIIFVIFLLYPIYFGHMAINANDTVITTCNVWITYLILKYLRNQDNYKRNKYIIFITFFLIFGSGVRLLFIGTLIPLIIFIFADIFFFKKFICKKFSIKIFFIDLVKIIISSYLLIILFWAPTHSNIFILPFTFFLELFSMSWAGWPLILLNEEYYFSNNPPIYYLLLNLFFKTPEYLLFLYLLSILLIFTSNSFFKSKFENFNYKIIFILFILFFPNFLFILKIFPVYDGLRLFLFILPFFMVIPSLVIFLLIYKFQNINFKILSLISLFLFVLFIIKFLAITPYHYTYLNFFSGNFKNQSKKFENDYWGVSLKELIKKSKFLNQNYNKLAICGASPGTVKYYLKKFKYSKVRVAREDENFDFIIMTNRAIFDGADDTSNAKTCFEKYAGHNISYVKRYGLVLSQIK